MESQILEMVLKQGGPMGLFLGLLVYVGRYFVRKIDEKDRRLEELLDRTNAAILDQVKSNEKLARALDRLAERINGESPPGGGGEARVPLHA